MSKLTLLVAGLIIGSTLTLSISASAQGGTVFSDVVDGTYFTDAVHKLMKRGVIRGYDDGRFGPQDFVTRGQVSVLLDRYDQTVVEPLRMQIELLRSELGLGRCGDQSVQLGEECDDGNMFNGDGCSRDCTKEILCMGKYREGETFAAPDGCNTCTCGRDGQIACTEMACVDDPKCTSSSECAEDEICSTERGDCLSACPPGSVVCPTVCAGYCIPAETDPSQQAACEKQEEILYNALDADYFCNRDADCRIFSQSCPYITCAAAVNKDQLPVLQSLAEVFLDQCNDEPIPCAGCIQTDVICEEGVCTLLEL